MSDPIKKPPTALPSSHSLGFLGLLIVMTTALPDLPQTNPELALVISVVCGIGWVGYCDWQRVRRARA